MVKAYGMANSAEPDQTALFRSSLFWVLHCLVRPVCSNSLELLRVSQNFHVNCMAENLFATFINRKYANDTE